MSKHEIMITGAAGRMGRSIGELAPNHAFVVGAAVDRVDGFVQSLDSVNWANIAVCIDFSSPHFLKELLPYLLKHRIPLVSGTTGLSPEMVSHLSDVSKTIPLFYATNMSRGVAVLRRLVQQATELLPEWDIELTEIHHHNKKDAPSGTANTLLDDIATVRSDINKVHGREGLVGARSTDEIGVHSVRAGGVVGEHTLLFAGSEERIEITHKAESRALFAHGALDAARWILTQPAGLYSMVDLIM
ncbi:4-hydroxy-tetrahydrodipicolinate reductase [bacterium]|nr:4-hydroxy-tetrahydrodipicolinate reductase [bacterium]